MEEKELKITVAGAGYVGLSLAVLLSQKYEVTVLEILEERVQMINNKISPIKDAEISEYLQNKKLNIYATSDYKKALKDADIVVISTPTNYDEETGYFDTKSVEDIIEKTMEVNKDATIIIKSTIPIGYTDKVREKYNNDNIIFSPEFLREGKALYDNLHPTRIIMGDTNKRAKEFGNILKSLSLDENTEIRYMDSKEAEAVKLFANTYLALRVAYFNELDIYAAENNLNTRNIIEGVCLDNRIGMHYNNPSFGYGGYCLPKDTKQLLANYNQIPQNLIKSIVDSNATRKEYIVKSILNKGVKTVGIYRLVMKKGSDNFRQSAIFDIIKGLQKANIKINIYEPKMSNDIEGCITINDLDKFKNDSEIIIANRYEECLKDVEEKLYTRDIFKRD